MEFLQPTKWREALEARAERPDALPIWGGTDVMVELNFNRARPPALLDLTRVGELEACERDDGWVRIGAGVTYTRVIRELGDVLPGLAMASRTVGSPQIRNRGTVGGNLGSASPAGDALPPLMGRASGRAALVSNASAQVAGVKKSMDSLLLLSVFRSGSVVGQSQAAGSGGAAALATVPSIRP